MAKDLCPYIKKTCIEHDCKFYQLVQGQHPQTGEHIDRWDCLLVQTMLMQLEGNKEIRDMSVEVNKLRNAFMLAYEQLAGRPHPLSIEAYKTLKSQGTLPGVV